MLGLKLNHVSKRGHWPQGWVPMVLDKSVLRISSGKWFGADHTTNSHLIHI